ncbi:hypothetical protein KBW71_02200 [Hydrogenophaga aromaticivorans]|uniref:hypothetical protein n=1 Tax=Hydrogenophaga aromaticivorans TaxID=2610898 RepID=UPI001B39AA52|nr:hypothetical protein [Hydrogenophaga aromaticivorans]MBQ0917243.1 hypothetical protein [Hydrogenophaga aromaticivorans]
MHKLERLTKYTAAKVNAQRVVISCLVSTHPDKAKLAKDLRRATEIVTVQHLNDEMVTDEVRDFIQKEVNEFIWVAEQPRTPPAG